METGLEKELVERARGDAKAFAALYDEYHDKIFGYILVRVARVDVAQDVTSSTFFKAPDGIKRYQWRGAPFSCWLYRIAGNEVAEHFRRDGHAHALAQKALEASGLLDGAAEAELLDAEAALSRREEFLDIHDKVSRLPVKYQEVIALRFFEELSLGDIAAVLGKREGTVKTLLYRGLERLKKMMEPGEPSPNNNPVEVGNERK